MAADVDHIWFTESGEAFQMHRYSMFLHMVPSEGFGDAGADGMNLEAQLAIPIHLWLYFSRPR